MLVNSDLAGSVGHEMAFPCLSFSFRVYWKPPRCPDGVETCIPQAGTNPPRIKMRQQCERRRVTASATEQQCSAGASVWIPILFFLLLGCLLVGLLVPLRSPGVSACLSSILSFVHICPECLPSKSACSVCNFEANGFSWFLDQQSRGLEQNLVLRSFRIYF